MSASIWQTNRDIATGFIQSVASRLGFPQRTIATAQQIYQRFHLFYPPSDFVLHEIAVASLFVGAKLNDTHKKPRDLLLASYALRFPQLVKGSSFASDIAAAGPSSSANAPVEEATFPTLAGQKRKQPPTATSTETLSSPRPLAMAIGSVGESDVDPSILETDRKRLMALEKLILESLCFNFHSSANTTLKMVIKLGRRCGMQKSFVRTAWKVAADMFRTSGPMQYPPNVVATAALYAAALLARPPPRVLPSQQQGEGDEVKIGEEEDAIREFLQRVKAVSSTPAPKEASTSRSDSPQIPLAEPFPDCDHESRVHVEDVEEAVHELLDLYLACTSQLPPSLYMSSASGLGPSHGHSGSTGATPSPLSPADTLDPFATSPSSSGGLSDGQQPTPGARKKLKQYEYSPPPFGLVDWLNSSRCTQLQGSLTTSSPTKSDRKIASSTGNSADPTAPTKELSTLLTDLKIYLRGIEYDRQRADDSYLASLNIIAEVNVIPLPGSGSDSNANTAGLLGNAAHSVAILLKPLNATQQAQGKEVDVTAGLNKEQKVVVERIKRRKLVAALRLTYTEPEVEKKFDTSTAAVLKRVQLQKEKQKALGTAAVVEDIAPNAKRNRIELAKRYLF